MQWKLIVEQTLTRAAGPVSLALGLLGLAAALPALVGTTRPDSATLLPHRTPQAGIGIAKELDA